jgi:hypothetical protein
MSKGEIMKIVALASLALMVDAAGAASPTPQAKPADPDKDRVICKSEPTKGRFTKRVCHTKAEWEQITKDAEAAVKEIQDRPGIVPCPPTAPGC